jgi:hypothetical protein
VNVHLHVDELVLDGLDGTDGAAVSQAVRVELARLFAARVPRLAAADAVDGGTVEAPRPGGEAALGTQVARAVYGGLGR